MSPAPPIQTWATPAAPPTHQAPETTSTATLAQTSPPARAGLGPVVLWTGLAFGILVAWVVLTFNRLVRTRNKLREARAGIDVQLKRRRDLVPALVDTVEAYRDHERDLFAAVARHRTEAERASRELDPAAGGATAAAAGAENALAHDITRLVALAERYPDLKADQAFRDLGAELVNLEDDLQYARRYYNGAVRDLNNLAGSFPSLLVARATGFAPGDFFEVESASDRLPPDLRNHLRS